MADIKPQTQEKSDTNPPASSTPQDYYAVLMKVINDVTRDHTQLRKLVYALAWQNLKPEVIVAKPIPQAQTQAKTIFEVAQAVQLERAIERIEAEARSESKRGNEPPISDNTAHAKPTQTEPPIIFQPADDLSHTTSVEHTPDPTVDPEPPVAVAQDLDPDLDPDLDQDLDQDLDAERLAVQNTGSRQPIERDPDIAALDASFEPPRAGGTLATLPEPRARSERKDIAQLERIPAWLDPSVRVSLDSVEYAPIRRTDTPGKSNFVPFIQLIAASAIGVVLYIGISGWVYLGRQQPSAPVHVPAPQAAANPPTAPDTALSSSQALAPPTRPSPEPQPVLPFPLPRTFGVYAGVPGQLFELQPLPIRVPDPRVQVSAEITKPSGVTTPGENLTFVVFRRDLVNSAPQTVNVRVVARVQHTTKFVDGKPTIVPFEGVWRIRSTSYEFKVSPLDGHNEMVVIQPNPGFVFQPGRYVLVLNGLGYDFTVAGKITAPEQCLEQVELVNGAVLSECPKT